MLKGECFLGLDLSTQSLTAAVIDSHAGGIRQFSINFDLSCPAYGTRGGVIPSDDPLQAHVNPLMWMDALEDMLGRLQKEGLTRRVVCLAVSAQQHGTVYLNRNAAEKMGRLSPAIGFAAGLGDIFSRPFCPIWMDSSTTQECREIHAAMGGGSALARLTGSVATERFAGPQIRKFWKKEPDAYERTAHIALISSFMTSLLIGRLAPVDAGDGFGTNLADVATGAWSAAALEAAAPGLRVKLPPLRVRDEVVGRVSPYLVQRFGLRPETEVLIGSGDNPCSLVGLGLIGVADVRAVSLGTSDTCFGYLPGLAEGERNEGHIFGAADGGCMFLVCFKNGSLARERVKDRFGLDWSEFSRILLETPPGNRGRIMLPYFMPEITPVILEAGARRFGGLAADDAAGNVRAVAEAQAMALYLHSGWAGKRPARIVVTAGGSENLGLLGVIADVFGAEVQTREVKESAALGAALRAAYAWRNAHGSPADWQELFGAIATSERGRVVRPSPDATRRYHAPNGLLEAYAACERFAQGEGLEPEAEIEAFRSAFPEA
jgi:xylulokinase